MIRNGTAPPNAIAPKALDNDKLFSLEIDDPIWDDRGLTDNDMEVPLWLGNDQAHEGIRAMLMQDRCEEEKVFLQREANALAYWFSTEWDTLQIALDHVGVCWTIISKYSFTDLRHR